MLVVVALMLLIRSGPDAADELAINVSTNSATSANAAPPVLTDPIAAPTIDDAQPAQASTGTVPDADNELPTPPPTTAAVVAATTEPLPTLAPAVLPTATTVPPTASSTTGTQLSGDTAASSALVDVAPTAALVPAPTSTPLPQPTATATVAPQPTATLAPLPTSTSTPAPQPTATPTFVPAPTATLIPEAAATSTPVPPTPTAAPTQSLSQLESWMLNEVNRVRANAGLSPLAPSSSLASIGRDWSQRMANAGGISHRPSDQLSAMMPPGWRGWAENVAQAPFGPYVGSVEEAVRWAQNALENSPGHYTNMVGNYNTLGIGLHVQGDYVWVTQNFGNY